MSSRHSISIALCCAMLVSAIQGQAMSTLQVQTLRCEYRVEPLGIDTPAPRLSWTVSSPERGQVKTGYRVLVADSPDALKADQGTLWDSGKEQSDETICIVYGGKPLTSLMRCYWKVKVWGKDGVESDWSETAMWQMGTLAEGDWKAQWVGMDNRPVNLALGPKADADVLKGSRWIWTPGEGDPAQGVPAGVRYFRKTFDLKDGAKVQQATLYIAADNSAQVFVNGTALDVRVGYSHAASLDIQDALRPGTNVFAIAARNDGNHPNPAGLLGKAVIMFTDDSRQIIPIDGSWTCFNRRIDGWQAAAFDDSGWNDAAAFADNGDRPWGEIGLSVLKLPAPVHLRRTFTADKPLRRATALVSAMGICQVSINGEPVGEDYFVPGWTDYIKRIYYVQYDVTGHIRAGENVIGGVLADGWFSGHIGWGYRREHYGRNPRLALQLHLEYDDNTTETVVTDGSWKVATGPTLEADFLMGETYDARRELSGWDRPGFDDSAWAKVAVGSSLRPRIQAYPGHTVQIFKEITPVSVTEPVKGAYVFDMGTNLAGVARLKVRGKGGDAIVLRFAERLNPDGTIYTDNLRSARATDTYICKGGGPEVWQPRFTFHGFQYVEVTGYPGVPDKEAVTAIELTSATPVVGSFACSEPMLNQLYRNICQTQRANFIDIPTDCPQRDERLGWTGDAQAYIRAASYNNDVQAFFTKWLVDLADAQRADGQFPQVAPLKVVDDDGGPGWSDAGVICPWTIYQVYGDRRLLARHYEGMKRYIAFCKNRTTEDLLPPSQFHCFGDWLNINDDTPKDVIYLSYFAYSTFLTARTAEVLEKPEEARHYDALFERIKAAFNKAYVAEDGKIKGDSQTTYVLALAHDLLDGERKQQAAEHLIRRIRDNNWHLSTGFLGTKDLMHVLSRIGRHDVAYRLLHNDTFPSWGFSIKHGATSIWERWNSWTPEGFGDVGMNSFSHYTYGAVGQWMFENIGGINTEGPAFKHIVLHPRPGGKLTWANVRYDSIRGPIASHWKKADGVFEWEVQIPANTTATAVVPTTDITSVRESGNPLTAVHGIEKVQDLPDAAVLNLVSGTYRFRTTIRQE